MDFVEIAERSVEGIVAFDRGWRYTYVNLQAERVVGRSRDDLLGRVVWDLFPAATSGPFYAFACRCMERRAAGTLEEFSAALGRWMEVRCEPARDGGLLTYFRDTHERHEADRRSERARERLLYLSRATALLTGSLDYERMLEQVLALAVPEVADYAYLYLAEGDRHGGGNGVREFVAHRDAGCAGAVCDALRRWPSASGRRPHPVRAAIENRSVEYTLRMSPEAVEVMAADADHLRLLSSLDMGSLVCVPLVARGRAMGALLFVRTGASGVLFTPEDVATLEELSHRAAAALENAALFRESQERLAEATRAREEVARLLSEKESAALAQRAFLRDVLRSVSEGRLRLCDSASEVPGPLPRAVCTPLTLTAPTLRDLRRRAEDAAQGVGLSHGRCADLILAAGEAGMNAVVHAGGGQATVTCDPGAGLVQVRVDDCGKGIAEAMLHRATLERGFSTGGTLGHGFLLMISAADRVYLLTGPEGTTVVIEQGRAAPLELEGW